MSGSWPLSWVYGIEEEVRLCVFSRGDGRVISRSRPVAQGRSDSRNNKVKGEMIRWRWQLTVDEVYGVCIMKLDCWLYQVDQVLFSQVGCKEWGEET